jgi:hypothetical protein
MSVTIKLRKPIQAHGKEIDELTLKEPTGGNLRRCGLPFGVGGVVETENVAKLISELGSVPPSTVDRLCALDFKEALEVVMHFFVETSPANASIGTGSSPTSSEEE